MIINNSIMSSSNINSLVLFPINKLKLSGLTIMNSTFLNITFFEIILQRNIEEIIYF